VTSVTNPNRKAEILNFGFFNIASDANMTNDQNNPGLDFINEPGGTFRKTAGTGTSTIQVLFENFGTLDIMGRAVSFSGGFIQNGGQVFLSNGLLDTTFYGLNNGTLVLGNTGSGQVKASSGLTIAQGSTLAGIGTVVGSVTNSGNIDLGQFGAPLGLLTVSGDYTQTGTGSLKLRLLQAQNHQYDSLAITGTATLAGTLTVVDLPGFNPAPGDIFTILTYAQEVGDFNQPYNLPALNPPRSWVAAQPGATSLKLVVQ
jgi:hypothetical protein